MALLAVSAFVSAHCNDWKVQSSAAGLIGFVVGRCLTYAMAGCVVKPLLCFAWSCLSIGYTLPLIVAGSLMVEVAAIVVGGIVGRYCVATIMSRLPSPLNVEGSLDLSGRSIWCKANIILYICCYAMVGPSLMGMGFDWIDSIIIRFLMGVAHQWINFPYLRLDLRTLLPVFDFIRTTIEHLPKKMTVSGDFQVEGHPSLSLPTDLEVKGNMFVIGSKMPSSCLKIAGEALFFLSSFPEASSVSIEKAAFIVTSREGSTPEQMSCPNVTIWPGSRAIAKKWAACISDSPSTSGSFVGNFILSLQEIEDRTRFSQEVQPWGCYNLGEQAGVNLLQKLRDQDLHLR